MSPEAPDGPLRPPPGRYGPPRRPLPRWLVALLVLCGVVAVVPLTVAVYDRFEPPVQADVLGFDVEPERATVRLILSKPDASGASCTLKAFDVSGEVVGSRLLEVREPGSSLRVEESFPTSREAVTVTAEGCRELSAD